MFPLATSYTLIKLSRIDQTSEHHCLAEKN
jgi:hypothetical protein